MRLSARAVVINNNSVLLNEFGNGLYYNFPGGGVEEGENLTETVIREVLEETELAISVEKLLFVFEYKDDAQKDDCRKHGVSFFFLCTPNDVKIKPATVVDSSDKENIVCTGAKWIPFEKLGDIDYVPKIHKNIMAFFDTGIFEPNYIFKHIQ